MKQVLAVRPYEWPGRFNFKITAYDGWVKAGGLSAKTHYPSRALHWLAFKCDAKQLVFRKHEARLRFVQPVSIKFDSFPDHFQYEVIPFIWDCWPQYFEKTARFLKRHKVKTAILTSSQTAELLRKAFPDMNIIFCPEGIDTSLYKSGRCLKERKIDLLEFGRTGHEHLNLKMPPQVNHSYHNKGTLQFATNDELYDALSDAKISISLPKNITNPELAGNIETLTQRYWECMLSRTVLLGVAPKELVDFIGYNPVVTIDKEHVNEQILDMLAHIEDYQPLVDKNRETALRLGDWSVRMRWLMEQLKDFGYTL